MIYKKCVHCGEQTLKNMCKECAIQVKMWGTSYESTGEKILEYFKKKIKASDGNSKSRPPDTKYKLSKKKSKVK